VSVLRRVALGFPLTWEHRRDHCFDALADPGAAPYFIEWDPRDAVYGEDWTGAPRDGNGVLLGVPQPHYHPIRIAQYALHRFGVWHRSANPQARADFLAQAVWLRDNQHDDGVAGLYRFSFPWRKYGADSGWASAMAQGEAISVLLRAERLQRNAGFGAAAARAAEPFRADIAHGGVVWKSRDDVFFEEIANRHAPHVLNGCIYALWGVWELGSVGGERWLGVVAQQCANTLRRWLPKFDTGWWTRYSLLRSSAGRPHLATLKYHQFHVAQMRVLERMFGDAAFGDAARRWAEYAQAARSRRRLIGETLIGLPERFFKRDTVLGGAST
jgi:hypothetical protein